jgi:hypothetical protein
MSEARELPAVVVSESEEEELLSEDEVVPEQVERQMPLVPLDRRGVSKIGTGDEFRLRNNYDIRPSVLLHFFKILLPGRFVGAISLFTRKCF